MTDYGALQFIGHRGRAGTHSRIR